ncbi:LAFE_0F00738g1_1 [Lachancea fermentati]|uniref:LAFE_0F00738g1_1 n=1 Tax=Lachancea fermentati TaxID=4955 RepID=A0A1G4MEI4_LACFM|nr:LAFE_0F00738g1_1 [Lachancea fermentati]
MSSNKPRKERASVVLAAACRSQPAARPPLQPKPVNISQLVRSPATRRVAAKSSPLSSGRTRPLSKLLTNSGPLPVGAPQAARHAPDTTANAARARMGARDSSSLLFRVSRAVSAVDTHWRLQRHARGTTRFDQVLAVRHMCVLSPSELLVVGHDRNCRETVVILHGDAATASRSPAPPPPYVLLESRSSLPLYHGRRWHFKWRFVARI